MVRLRYAKLQHIAQNSFAGKKNIEETLLLEPLRPFIFSQLTYGIISLLGNTANLILATLVEPPVQLYPARIPTSIVLWIFYLVICLFALFGSANIVVALYPVLLTFWTVLILIGWVIIPIRYVRMGNVDNFYSPETAIGIILFHFVGFVVNILGIFACFVHIRKINKRVIVKRKK